MTNKVNSDPTPTSSNAVNHGLPPKVDSGTDKEFYKPFKNRLLGSSAVNNLTPGKERPTTTDEAFAKFAEELQDGLPDSYDDFIAEDGDE